LPNADCGVGIIEKSEIRNPKWGKGGVIMAGITVSRQLGSLAWTPEGFLWEIR
jgi:hypothetical protein